MASIRSLTIGGVGATPSLDDVVRIAGGQPVVLDTNACDRIKKASPPPKAFQAEPAPAPGSDDASAAAAGLLPRQARAVVATKLLSLVNGSSGVRLQVCQYLAELLNSGVVPRLPAVETDAGLLSALADACHGAGASAATGDASAPGDAPGLSAAERAVLEGGASGSAGVACLAVAAARQLLALAPAVAALSIEAAGAPVKPFDTAVINAQGYKSAAAVADELRTLLEGSKRAGVRLRRRLRRSERLMRRLIRAMEWDA
ncbi:hypothetical protein FOA52_005733 [Chlamydomonas sp. UWO 241]|nr:hypothetical protein FOA52_005733 [Chlamydomonas sp. UWO 241]